MTTTHDAFAAGLALGMKTPLARVELAASQLEREVGTPSARRLAEGIGEAVAELDQRIAQLISMLTPARSSQASMQSLSAVLPRLRERLAPVLAARGVEWMEAAEDADATGDPEVVRLTALAMIRAGADLAGEGGRVSLVLTNEAGRCGLRLESFQGSDNRTFENVEPSLRELRTRVLTQGDSLEIEQSVNACRASVWFEQWGDPCIGS